MHIGLHKTGTSSIQESLIQNKKKLKTDGILYLNDLINLNKIINSDSFNQLLADQFLNEIEKVLKKDKNNIRKVIISNESLSGNPFADYNNNNIIIKYLSALNKLFDTKIIIYLRRQDEFIESLYTQSIKSGNTHIFDKFIKSFNTQKFNWYNYLKQWLEYFTKNDLKIRIYNKRTLAKGNVVHDFANIINSQVLKEDKRSYQINSGYSQKSLEIARSFNQYLNKEEIKHIRPYLEKIDPKIKFNSFNYFSYKDRKQLLSYYEKSNKELMKYYSIGITKEFFKIEKEKDKKDGQLKINSENHIIIISKLFSLLIKENITLRHKTKPSLKNLSRMLSYLLKNSLKN